MQKTIQENGQPSEVLLNPVSALAQAQGIPTYPIRPMNGGRLELKSEDFLERHDVQPKVNDHRIIIDRASGVFWNRYGDRLSTASMFRAAFRMLDSQLPKEPEFKWLDCLGMGRRTKLGAWSLYLLDLPDHPGPFWQRNRDIAKFVEIHKYDEKPQLEHAYCLTTWVNAPVAKMLKVQAELKAVNLEWGEEYYEGVVAKRADAKYSKQSRDPDKASPDMVKFRWRY